MVEQHRKGGTIARIVNVSSVSAIDPFPGLSIYGATKGAINALTRGCANEGRDVGIRAFAVAPGAVETAMLRAIASEEQLPRTATLTPEQVAGVIVACAVGERDEENGGVIVVPSG
jgi:3-oxoacyl-[acyl-carrier protein] reductase